MRSMSMVRAALASGVASREFASGVHPFTAAIVSNRVVPRMFGNLRPKVFRRRRRGGAGGFREVGQACDTGCTVRARAAARESGLQDMGSGHSAATPSFVDFWTIDRI
jgi:hypothetical protein